jgi:DNA polymerase III subunit chi
MTATEIRFYHLERQGIEQALPGLISKALENGHRIIVKTANENEMQRLNEHLWIYNPNSFIPHGTRKDAYPEKQPVLLTTQDENLNNADVLILTHGVESAQQGNFKLCCEMLDGRDSEVVSTARLRWQKYKDEGFAVTYWQQGDKGWEKKSG